MRKRASGYSTEQDLPETMIEAVRQFADPDAAHNFFVKMRWPNGVGCPLSDCGSMAVAYMPKRRRFYCNDCKRQFTAKVGTIFEDSPVGFDKWLPAFWLIVSNRNGISSHELARALHVTQKTAWFMLHRIREALHDEAFDQFRGDVEADEAYIGGKWDRTNSRRLRALKRAGKTPQSSKTMVFGIVERGGRARAWSVPSNRKQTLLPKLAESIHHGATLHTDSLEAYTHVDEMFLYHYVVDHGIFQYVRGHAHVNNIEGFWSVLKRTIGGTYIHIHPRHVDRYLDEQIFRFNERKSDDGTRFVRATKGADGKRLTYKVPIAKK